MSEVTLASRLDRADDEQGATRKGVGVGVHQAPRPRVGMRHEAGQHAPGVKAVPRRLQRGAHLGGVVRVVVDEGHAANLAADLETTADALKPTDRFDRGGNRHADTNGGGERRQRVRRIVLTGQPGGDDGEDLPLVPGGEAHPIPIDLHVAPLPVGAAAKTEGLDVGPRAAEQPADGRIVRVGDQAVLRAEILEQLAKDRLISRGIGKDVGVIPIDVGEHRQLRREVKELGPRIEDRGGVLVALEDELPAAAPGRRGAEVARGHAQAEPGVAPGHPEDPGDQAGGRRLPRRAGHHDAKAVRGQLAPVLGLADEADLVPSRRLGFRIAVAHLVPLDHEVRLPPAHDVTSRVTVDPLDAGLRQHVGRRRIGVLVRAGDLVAELFGNERQPRDRVPADADEVDSHQWRRAASWRSLTTSSAAYGRPNPRMASTILRYRAASLMTDVSTPRSRPATSSSGITMAAPADA